MYHLLSELVIVQEVFLLSRLRAGWDKGGVAADCNTDAVADAVGDVGRVAVGWTGAVALNPAVLASCKCKGDFRPRKS